MAKPISTSGNRPKWKLFEEAVGAFLQALDSTANVTKDVLIPDVDTGEPRQRDVWIETLVGGHIPIKILVSCKRKKRKLSQQDIDAFVGELRSSGASKGVIYAFGGYSQPALKKAKKLGIACCTLYADRAPDLPQVLSFSSFVFQEIYRLRVFGGGISTNEEVRDLLNETILFEGQELQLSRVLADGYGRNRPNLQEKSMVSNPPTWHYDVPLRLGENDNQFILRIEGYWRKYEAKQDAYLLNGSYSFENDDFKGSFATPYVDRMSKHPGPGWNEVDPSVELREQNVISMFLFGGDVEQSLRQQYGC